VKVSLRKFFAFLRKENHTSRPDKELRGGGEKIVVEMGRGDRKKCFS